MSDSVVPVNLRVNGTEYPAMIDDGQNLLGVIRNTIGLTGTKEGCDDCECGACMVLIDGRPVNSCSFLAAQAQGRDITTVEGLAGPNGDLHDLQRAILDAAGVQCGFCTPGMLVSAAALLARDSDPSRDDIAFAISGNLCRCTGYARIVDAIAKVANARRSPPKSGDPEPQGSGSTEDGVSS